MRNKKNISPKKKGKELKKYYMKIDVFLSRMASILKVPTGLAYRAFSERAATTIRLNPLTQDVKKTYEELSSLGAQMVEVPWIKETYIVSNMDKSELAQTQMYKDGHFYIQNLSSMLPAIVLNPTPKDVVLDMCAAPGSKTTQMAAMMNNKGVLVANDDDQYRGEKLKLILSMFGVKNVQIRYGKGEAIGKREENHYDKILLDAPCSGEGLIYLKGDKPLRFWNIKKVKPLANIQKELIVSAFQALKKGGTLVYSTCTMEPDENEGVVTHLLNKFENAQVEQIELFNEESFQEYKKFLKKGIGDFNGVDYLPEVLRTYRVMPNAKMMGFYIAKIVKK